MTFFIRNIGNKVSNFFVIQRLSINTYHNLVLFSSFLLINFIKFLFFKVHHTIITACTSTHVRTLHSHFKAFTVVSIASYFRTTTTSRVKLFLPLIFVDLLVFLLKCQRIDLLCLLYYKFTNLFVLLLIQTPLTSTFRPTNPTILKTSTIQS